MGQGKPGGLGIWNHWGLLKWEAIDAWEFREDDPTWLVLRSNTALPFLRTGVLKVSDTCRERLVGLLRENVHESATNRVGLEVAMSPFAPQK